MPVTLKKQLGVIDGISYVSGAIIGSGIFISPSPVLMGSGGSTGIALTVWTVCGILAMIEALCFLELVLRVRKSGGTYIFIKEAFGGTISFLALWLDTVIFRPLSSSLAAIAAGTYIMRPFFLRCQEMAPPAAVKLLGMFILVFYSIVNAYSIKKAVHLQIGVTTTKIISLGVIAVVGFIALIKGKVENFKNAFSPDGLEVDGFVFAILIGMYSYGGGITAVYAYEEYINPKRDLTISMVIGHIIPLVIYIAANVAYYSVLTKQEITSGIAVAVAFGERCSEGLMWVILVCVVLSTSGSLNNQYFKTTRAMHTGAREGHFPRYLSMLSVKNKSFLPGIITLTIFSMVFVLILDFMSALKVYAFFSSSYRLVAILGLFKIRNTHNPEGVLKLPSVIPALYVLLYIVMTVTLIVFTPAILKVSVILVVAALVVHILARLGRQENSNINKVYSKIHNYIVKLCRVVLHCEFSSET